MERDADVVIIGGGPAGTATALMLRRHAPSFTVVIVERSEFGQVRIGETLPPHAQPLLRQLDVWDDFLASGHVPAHGTTAAWGHSDLHANEFIFSPYGRGWHLDRRRFDQRLAELAEERGAELLSGTRLVEHARTNNGWRLAIDHQGQRRELHARFVVDATGQTASFARKQGARKLLSDQLVGVYVLFDLAPEDPAADSLTCVEAFEQGWWYSAILPGDQFVVACMTDADLCQEEGFGEQQGWFAALSGTEHTRQRVSRARPQASPSVRIAHSHRLDRCFGERWLAVGDAASAYDPLSGHGIFKAVQFGIFAAYAVSDALSGKAASVEKYGKIVASAFDGYTRTALDYYCQERRWPAWPFWRRRHEPRPAAT